MATSTVDVGMMKHKMNVIYRELNELRNQLEVPEVSENKNARAYEKLNILGGKIRKKTGAVSTKDIVNDVRS